MREVEYYFKKLTIFNNSGAFGSDLVKYELYKGDILLGELTHDIYYNKYTIRFGDQVFLMEQHFWKGVTICETITGKKIAGVRFSSGLFSGLRTARINFGKKDFIEFSINDFKDQKTYKFHCKGLMSDIFVDMLVLNPRPDEIMLLREKPLSGEITAKDVADPFRTLCVLAALEYLILYIDTHRNKSRY